jgi:NADPH:quinone reductase-like Zn-dependent oxidoreductase
VAINYKTEDFVQRVKDETGAGADVILDMVGGPYLARNIDALAPNGRLAIIGMQGGTKTEFDLNSLMRKRASVIATALRARPVAEKAAIVARVREVVWPMIEVGAIRPVVDRVVPMRDAAEAHRVMESGHHIGKVVLAV